MRCQGAVMALGLGDRHALIIVPGHRFRLVTESTIATKQDRILHPIRNPGLHVVSMLMDSHVACRESSGKIPLLASH